MQTSPDMTSLNAQAKFLHTMKEMWEDLTVCVAECGYTTLSCQAC